MSIEKVITFSDGRKVDFDSVAATAVGRNVIFVPREFIGDMFGKLHLPDSVKLGMFDDLSQRGETHNGFDFVSMNIYFEENTNQRPSNVHILLSEDILLFVHDGQWVISNLIAHMENEMDESVFEDSLLFFFNSVCERDAKNLLVIEQAVADFEDDIISSKATDCSRELVDLRRKLLSYKRYYEATMSTYIELEKNANGLFCADRIRYFLMLVGRCDRNLHVIYSLSDYVTQVSDAFRAQVEIELNKTLKLFTVIVAIFLPLSLVAAWYGMNLKMPEYFAEYGYPSVLLASGLIIVLGFWYFRKKKFI